MKYHMKDIFPYKNLAFLDNEYTDFMHTKNIYLKDRSDKNYLELTFAYTAMDSHLKELLSDGFLTLDEMYLIREKLKEGV